MKKRQFTRYPLLKSVYFSSDDQLKSLLTTYGPLSVAIDATESFLSYKRGVFKGCSPSGDEYNINHALLLIGYDSAGNWIVKNSWGEDWGDNGYAIISKDRNCGIDLYAEYLELTDGKMNISLKLFNEDNKGWEGLTLEVRQLN